jgi:sec-independent protein translocase protein TatA
MLGLDNPLHIAFLLVLVLLVFGAKRLPEMGRSLGAGMRGFRDEITSHADAVKGELNGAAPQATVAAEAPARAAEPAQRV